MSTISWLRYCINTQAGPAADQYRNRIQKNFNWTERIGENLSDLYPCAVLPVWHPIKVNIKRKRSEFKITFYDATNRIHFATMIFITKIWKNQKRTFFWSISIMQILDFADMILLIIFYTAGTVKQNDLFRMINIQISLLYWRWRGFLTKCCTLLINNTYFTQTVFLELCGDIRRPIWKFTDRSHSFYTLYCAGWYN